MASETRLEERNQRRNYNLRGSRYVRKIRMTEKLTVNLLNENKAKLWKKNLADRI